MHNKQRRPEESNRNRDTSTRKIVDCFKPNKEVLTEAPGRHKLERTVRNNESSPPFLISDNWIVKKQV